MLDLWLGISMVVYKLRIKINMRIIKKFDKDIPYSLVNLLASRIFGKLVGNLAKSYSCYT